MNYSPGISTIDHQFPTIKITDTQKNINSQFSIDTSVQMILANGNTQFMLQLARQMKFSYSLPTIALQISSKFFHIRCYVNYDRFIILTACLLLAAKFKDMDLRVKNLCYAFYKTITNRSQTHQPYDEDKLRKIRDQICIAQAQILRTLQYQIQCTTPHQYVKKYTEICLQNNSSIKKRIYQATRIIILDSNRVQLSLYYNPLTIFVSCFMIACMYQGSRPYLYLQVSPLTNISGNANNQAKTQQQLYRQWLNLLERSEGLKVKQQDVKQCVKMLNKIIFVGDQQ